MTSQYPNKEAESTVDACCANIFMHLHTLQAGINQALEANPGHPTKGPLADSLHTIWTASRVLEIEFGALEDILLPVAE